MARGLSKTREFSVEDTDSQYINDDGEAVFYRHYTVIVDGVCAASHKSYEGCFEMLKAKMAEEISKQVADAKKTLEQFGEVSNG